MLYVLDYDRRPPPPYNRRAVISFVLALMSAGPWLLQWIWESTSTSIPSNFGYCCCLSPMGSLLALTFGIMALAQFSNQGGNRYRGRWMAIIGISLAIISLLATCIYIFAILVKPPRTF